MGVPSYILFAGANGAGKSTLYRSGLWTRNPGERRLARINPDEILVSHGWDSADAKAQIRAGKEAVRRVRSCLGQRESFNQETTLSGRSIMRTIDQAKRIGYRVTMHYVGLESPSIALDRIAGRISHGGHAIPEEDVLRRSASSVKNLSAAIALCDEVNLFDNTEILRLVVRFEQAALVQHEAFPRVEWVERLLANVPGQA